MAWIVFDLDSTLLESFAPGQSQPTEGAVEATNSLAQEGHRLTVYTSRFAVMPDSERSRLKVEFEQELSGWGFPPIEVWTGTTKPDADVFIGANHITYDHDWGLALAQVQAVLEDRGIAPAAQPEAPQEEPQ